MDGRMKRFLKKAVLPELQRKLPLVEIVGEESVLIENHRSVKQYGAERICVGVAFGCIRVQGRGLHLYKMNHSQLMIKGRILAVSLEATNQKRR